MRRENVNSKEKDAGKVIQMINYLSYYRAEKLCNIQGENWKEKFKFQREKGRGK